MDNPTPNLLARIASFDNPWSVVGLIGLIVLLRLATPHLRSIRSYRGLVLEYVDSFLVAVVLVFCILRPFVVQAFFIPSGSMMNTLLEDDRILVSKFTYFFREPVPGEVVVFDAPPQASQQKRDFIKRVVAVAGDRVAVRNGTLYRNGVPIDEPYIRERMREEWPEPFDELAVLRPGEQPVQVVKNGEVVVPAGYLLVCGDNRNASNDSRKWLAPDASGVLRPAPFLPRENLLGKALAIFWPPSRIGLIRSYTDQASNSPTGVDRHARLPEPASVR